MVISVKKLLLFVRDWGQRGNDPTSGCDFG